MNIVPLPVDDKEYYGSRIGSYRAELEAIGVVVDLDGAMGIQNSFLYTQVNIVFKKFNQRQCVLLTQSHQVHEYNNAVTITQYNSLLVRGEVVEELSWL